jgi:hypothetical protein
MFTKETVSPDSVKKDTRIDGEMQIQLVFEDYCKNCNRPQSLRVEEFCDGCSQRF